MRKVLQTVFVATVAFATAFSPWVRADTLPIGLAHAVVNKAVELVESRGLYPRQQAEYDQAKASLMATFDGEPAEIDRQNLYSRLRRLLATLDANGHTFLIPPGRQLMVERKQTSLDDLPPPAFQLIKTSHGTVLRWTPPPIMSNGTSAISPYLQRFHDAAASTPDIEHACALVVDLSEQSGGNAWPPLVAMHPLFSDANQASWVDRDGKRTLFVEREKLEAMSRNFGDGRANPLSRFDSGPLGVVVAKRTSSAGEMLLIALLGEARVQTFGNTTSGMTTANATHVLADGSALVLTQSRFALGDGPVYRGGVTPMHQVEPGQNPNDVILLAATWVAERSPRCRSAAGK